MNNRIFRFDISSFFLKENVRYPVWTCRGPKIISLILGTRLSTLRKPDIRPIKAAEQNVYRATPAKVTSEFGVFQRCDLNNVDTPKTALLHRMLLSNVGCLLKTFPIIAKEANT